MSSFEDFFSYFLILNAVILPILYLLGYRRYSGAYRYVTWYLICIAIIQVTMTIYAMNGWNNLFMSHFYMIGQFVLLSLFYHSLLKRTFILYILYIVLGGLAVSYCYNFEIFYGFHSYGMSITQIILALYALGYYYLSLGERRPFLHINSGVLIYMLGSTLYFASYNLVLVLKLNKETSSYLIYMNHLLYFIFQITLFLEWYKNYRTIKVNKN